MPGLLSSAVKAVMVQTQVCLAAAALLPDSVFRKW